MHIITYNITKQIKKNEAGTKPKPLNSVIFNQNQMLLH